MALSHTLLCFDVLQDSLPGKVNAKAEVGSYPHISDPGLVLTRLTLRVISPQTGGVGATYPEALWHAGQEVLASKPSRNAFLQSRNLSASARPRSWHWFPHKTLALRCLRKQEAGQIDTCLP